VPETTDLFKNKVSQPKTEGRREAIALHETIKKKYESKGFDIEGLDVEKCEVDKVCENVSVNATFQLFDVEKLKLVLPEHHSSKKADLHQKLRKHSGYVEPRSLPSNYEKIMDEMDVLYPHFDEVNAYIRQRMRLYSLRNNPVLHFGSNILLDGPAGVGKSSYLFELSQRLDTLFHNVDCARASNGSDLTGLSGKWGTGEYGRLHDLLFNHGCPNPIIMLDEVEKSETDANHPIIKVLYGLLEPNNARHFKDEFVEVPMDASLINWFGTCNYIDKLDAPLRDRFEVLSVKAPTTDDLHTIIPNLYSKMLKRHSLESAFAKQINSSVVEYLAMSDGISLRRINSALETGLSNAAHRVQSKVNRKQRIRLQVKDMPVIETKRKHKTNPIGFIWGC